MRLEDLEVYQLSFELSNEIWEVYLQLPKQFKFNIGTQVVRAIDSIGANIAEGFGRYHYKDSMKFYYNARGSLFESKHWLKLLYSRKLIERDVYESSINKFDKLRIKLNNFIDSIRQKLQITMNNYE